LTAKYFSPALLEDELNLIRDRFNGEQHEDEHQHEDHDDHADVESEFLVKIGGARVKAKYEFLDVVMNISFKIPVSYPLLNVVVEMKKLIKVSTQQAQHLELKMKRILSSHNKTLKDAIVMWKQEMDSHFTGVEECTICYYVMNNYRELPRMTCKTCKKIFHAGCLYKWFESSGKSTCPMCRALF
jgi:hypothetical protein